MSRNSSSKLLSTVAALVVFACAIPAQAQQSVSPRKPSQAAVKAELARLPLAFEANRGQSDARVRYLSRGAGYTLFLAKDEAVLALSAGKGRSEYLRVGLLGAQKNVTIAGAEPLQGTTNYFRGRDRNKWQTGVKSFGKVRYQGVYPGIDLEYYGNQQSVEHDFVVAPFADASRIAMQIEGAKRLVVDEAGTLLMHTSGGVVRFEKPIVYQQIEGKRKEIAGAYQIAKNNRIGFKLGAYDRSKALVIDPVINYASYLASAGSVTMEAIAVDPAGDIYVAGVTSSATFPGPIDASNASGPGGADDIFIAKFEAARLASRLKWLTVVGGANAESQARIAVDATAAYFSALTASPADFPIVGTPYVGASATAAQVVGVLDGTTGAVSYTSFLDGTGALTTPRAIATDGAGDIFVTGSTSDATYPTTAGAFETAPTGTAVYVSQLRPSTGAAGLIYSTFISGAAGTNVAEGAAIAVAGGLAYVAGTSSETFPDGAGGFNATTGQDGFVARINPAGGGAADLEYATLIAGNTDDEPEAIAVDAATDDVYVVGHTDSNAGISTAGALQAAIGGALDGFVISLDTTGAITAGTYLGGTGDDRVHSIAFSGSDLIVGGESFSGDLANLNGEAKVSAAGVQSGFVAKLPVALTSTTYLSYIGGTTANQVKSVATDAAGAAYVAGQVSSADLYTTASAFQAGSASGGYFAKFDSAAANGAVLAFSTGTITTSSPTTTPAGLVGEETASIPAVASTITYDYTVTETGGFAANNLTFNWPMPIEANTAQPAVSVTSTTPAIGAGCESSANGVTCSLGNLAASGAASVQIVASPTTAAGCSNADACTTSNTISNTATVASAETGTTSLLLSASARPVTDLTLNTLAAAGDVSGAGLFVPQVDASFTYTMNVVNNGPNTAPSASVTLTLPAGFTATTISITTANSTASCGAQAGTQVVCSLTNLTTGAGTNSETITIAGDPTALLATNTASTTNQLDISATVTDATGTYIDADTANDTAALNGSELRRVADVSITSIDATPDVSGLNNPFVADVDSSISYTVNLANAAGNSTATDIDLSITVPAGFALTSGAPCTQAGGAGTAISCPLAVATLAAGGTTSFAFTGTPAALSAASASTTISIFATATGGYVDGTGANNTSIQKDVTQERNADIEVTGVTSASDVSGVGLFVEQVDSSITYTVAITNNGPSTATNIDVQLSAVPASFTLTSAGCTQAGGAGTAISCAAPIASLASAASTTFDITGTPSALASSVSQQTLAATGAANSTTGNDAVANNSASASTISQERRAEIQFDSLAVAGNVSGAGLFVEQVDSLLTYTVTLTNNGPSTATAIDVNLGTVPAGFTLTAPGGCTQAGGAGTAISCPAFIASLGNGATTAIAIVGTPSALAAATSQQTLAAAAASVASSGIIDSNAGNNAGNSATVSQERRAEIQFDGVTVAGDVSGANLFIEQVDSTLTYTVSLTNNGPSTATNIDVALGTVSAGFAVTSAGCTQAGGAGTAITCATAIASLANGASTTFAITGTPSALPNAASQQTLAAAAASISSVGIIDSNAGNNAGNSATVSQERRSEIQQTGLTAAGNVSGAGNFVEDVDSSVDYTVAIINNGPSTATNISVTTSAIPAAFTLTGPAGCTQAGGIGTAVTCNAIVASLANAATTNVVFSGTLAALSDTLATQTISATTNIASTSVIDANGGNNTGSANILRQRNSDIRITGVTAAPNVSGVGNPYVETRDSSLTFTVSVFNFGPSVATHLNMVATLPSGFSVTASPAGCVYAAPTLTCNDVLVSLAVGATSNLVITGTPTALGANIASQTLAASANVSSTSVVDVAGNNTGNVALVQERNSDLEVLSLIAAPNVSGAGNAFIDTTDSTIVYTANLRNNGPSDATNVQLIVNLPAGTLVPAPPAGCSYNGGIARLTCTVTGGNVANLATPSVSFTATPPTLNANSIFAVLSANTAISSTSVTDTGTGNNTGSVNTTQRRDSDLSITSVTATPDNSATGTAFEVTTSTNMTYAITVANAGPSNATNVVMTDVLPASVSFVSASAGCVNAAGTVTCTVGNLAAGANTVLNIVVAPSLPTNVANLTAVNTPTVASSSVNDIAPGNNNASVSTQLQRNADIAVTSLTATPITGGAAGDPFVLTTHAQLQYDLTVHNFGPSDATNVILTDVLPPALAFSSATVGCSAVGQTVTCTIGNLANGGDAVIQIIVTPTLSAAAASATVNNILSTASSSVNDAAPGNNSASASTQLQRNSELELVSVTSTPNVSGTGNPFVVTTDTTLDYTITIRNNGPSDATNVVVTDILPANTTFASASAGCVNAAGTVTCSVGTLANGASQVLTITVTPSLSAASASATITNAPTTGSSSVTDAITANNSASVSTQLQRNSDLAITSVTSTPNVSGTGNPWVVTTDNSLTYAITSLNNGPSDATNLVVTDILPAGVTFASASAGCSNAAGTVTCNIAILANGASTVVSIVVTPSLSTAIASTSITNTPSVASSSLTDGTPANNTASVSTALQRNSDLELVSITSTPDVSGTGNPFVVTTDTTLRYDITVRNNGASDATNVVLTDVLPASVNFTSASAGCVNSSGTVTCTIGNLAAGASTLIQITVTPNPPGVPTATITNNPSVTSNSVNDLVPSNNGSINNTTIQQRNADLAVAITGPVTPIIVGPNLQQTITYTVTATNNGPSEATNVVVTNILPADLAFTSAAGICSNAAGTITCAVGTLANGASTSFTITVTPSLSASVSTSVITNTVTISSNTVLDNTSANNSASFNTNQRGEANVQIGIAATPNPDVLAGNNLTYTLTVTNNGPFPAANLTVVDVLPAGVTLLSVTSTSFVCGGTTTCTLGSLANGSAATITIVVNVPASAITGQNVTLTNSASVTEFNAASPAVNDTDPDNANNVASFNTTARAAADLTISQTAPSPVQAGDAVPFVVTINNIAGRSTATNAVVTNAISVAPSASVTSVTGLSPGCVVAGVGAGGVSAGATITCTITSIATGASPTISFTVTPSLPGFINNTASVTATEVEVVPADNATPLLSVTVNNTPISGVPVTVSPVDPSTGLTPANVTITFPAVSAPGITTLTITSTGPALPLNYRAGSPSLIYYNIGTNAVFTPTALVCVNFAPTAFQKPERVRLFIATGGTGIDTTVSLNQAASQVCGRPASLTATPVAFVVVEPINHAPIARGTAVTTGSSGKGITGASATLDASASTDQDTDPCNGATLASGITCADQPQLTYRWVGNFTDGTSQVTTQPILPDVAVPLGSQNLTLTVTDQLGAFTTTTVPLTVVGSVVIIDGSATVNAGQAATFPNQQVQHFSNVTSFNVTGTPDLAANQITCSVSPNAITHTLAIGVEEISNITVLCSTTAPVLAKSAPYPSAPASNGFMVAGAVGLGSIPLLGLVMWLPVRNSRERKRRALAIFALLIVLVFFQAACGGGGGGFGGAPTVKNAGTPKGVYTISVTGNGGASLVRGSLKLTVQ